MLISQISSSNAVLYVQSATAKLLTDPSYKSVVLKNIERGAPLNIIEQTERWSKVQFEDSTGWISTMLLSASQPQMTKSLLNGHKDHLEKTSRRRASNNTTAAATRGLRQNTKSRASDNLKADYDALKEVESTSVTNEDALKFHETIQ